MAEGLKILLDDAEKTKKAYLELEVELAKPVGLVVQQSAEAIGSDLDKLTAKVAALQKQLAGTPHKIGELLKGGGLVPEGSGLALLFPKAVTPSVSPDAKALIAAEAELKVVTEARADAELRIVAIKRQGLKVSSESAAIAKAQLDYANATATLLKTAFTPDADQKAIFKRVLALRQERDLTKETARNKASLENDSLAHARELADIEAAGLSKEDEAIAKLGSELAYRRLILAEAEKLGEIKGIAAADVGVAQALAALAKLKQQFAQDVGSGKFVNQTIPQEDLEKRQREAGEAVIAELRDSVARGIPLGPNAQRILKEADRLDKVGSKDFSGLAALDGLQFTSLRALDGLTITIK